MEVAVHDYLATKLNILLCASTRHSQGEAMAISRMQINVLYYFYIESGSHILRCEIKFWGKVWTWNGHWVDVLMMIITSSPRPQPDQSLIFFPRENIAGDKTRLRQRILRMPLIAGMETSAFSNVDDKAINHRSVELQITRRN